MLNSMDAQQRRCPQLTSCDAHPHTPHHGNNNSSNRMSPQAGHSSDVDRASSRTEESPPSSPSMGSSKPSKEWKFTQWFKKMPSQGMLPDADVLSAVEFDHSGSFLATGDRGGRIVVLEFDGSKKATTDTKQESPSPSSKRNKSQPAIHYKFHCEFQSHDPEFDYVKSLAIDERINKIKWLQPTNNAQYMLSTNGEWTARCCFCCWCDHCICVCVCLTSWEYYKV
jgi:hypothetical protein